MSRFFIRGSTSQAQLPSVLIMGVWLRQYFPKGRELTDVVQEEIEHAMARLNHRPRKTLGFQTPFEVFFSTKTPLTVALGVESRSGNTERKP